MKNSSELMHSKKLGGEFSKDRNNSARQLFNFLPLIESI